MASPPMNSFISSKSSETGMATMRVDSGKSCSNLWRCCRNRPRAVVGMFVFDRIIMNSVNAAARISSESANASAVSNIVVTTSPEPNRANSARASRAWSSVFGSRSLSVRAS